MNFFLSRDWNRVRTRVRRYWDAGWRPVGRPFGDLPDAVRNFRSGYRFRLRSSQSKQVVGGAHMGLSPFRSTHLVNSPISITPPIAFPASV
jgi:hypothetical protein